MRETPRARTLVLTFDDAFRSVLTKGLSVLRGLGVPATLFVPTDFAAEGSLMDWSTLGKSVGTADEEELRCLTWDGVRDLAAAGWEIGSHTASHPRLTELDAGAAAAELRSSREACEEALQRSCDSLAYPFGDWNPKVAELAGQEGYRRAVTLSTRPLEPLVDLRRSLELSRDGVYRWTSRPEFFLVSSPALRRLRASSTYRRVRDARRDSFGALGSAPILAAVPGEPEWQPTGRVRSLASADIQATLFALAVPCSRGAAIRHVLFKPGLQAVLLHRLASFLVRRRVPVMPWVISLLATYVTGAEIGPRAIFGPGMVIYHPAGVVIHGEVRAGRNVRLHSGVVIGVRKGLPNPPRLGDDVRIGANATILGDLSVGDHARIGANAAVISDVPAGHVALGVPAVSRPRSA